MCTGAIRSNGAWNQNQNVLDFEHLQSTESEVPGCDPRVSRSCVPRVRRTDVDE